MTNLTPAATFDSVQQLEATTVALGGAGAPMNVQAQALLNRTQYLYVQLSNLATVATTGDYNSLINRPSLGSAAYQPSSAFATAAQGAKADGAAQAGSLSSVAFSGAYAELTGKPFASDAPSDGSIYGRKNGAWVVAATSSPLVNPMTSPGDIIIGGTAGAPLRLPIGSEGQVLTVSGGALVYADPTGGGGGGTAGALAGINNQTGTSYTLVLTDAGKDIRCNNGATVTITIPPNSAVAFPVGTFLFFSQSGTGTVTAAAGSGVTLNTYSGYSTAGQHDVRGLEQVAADVWRVV